MEFTATATTGGGGFNQRLHRIDPESGEIVHELPDFETEYGCPDEKRYVLRFVGYSDVFEDTGYETSELVDKMIVEFEVVNSKKWQGVRFSEIAAIPKDWTDNRGTLNRLFSAISGKAIEHGDRISVSELLGKQFEGEVIQKTSAKGREYAKVKTYLALNAAADDDDLIPVGAMAAKPTAPAPAADDEFPTE